jgi:GDPmannose 4,6-dehydratase
VKALITGVTGQDGSYLSELLLEKGYEVHGTKRRSSSFNTGRVDHLIIHPRFKLHYGDVCDSLSMVRLLEEIRPDEIYNLAAQSHVAVSFEMPEYSADAAGMGALRLFEAARMSGLDPRIYQASSSEMFGDSPAPQSLASHFRPCSPYACAKLMAHHAARVYRESYGMYISCGILFNHESPRRGETFVTRKIARAVAQIKAGKQEHLYLGNLEAKRDWGYAPEYVDAMWRMLQASEAIDLCIGTGEMHSVREFVVAAFEHAGLDWRRHVHVDERLFRANEVPELQCKKWAREIDWLPRTAFAGLVKIMVQAELDLALVAL